MENEFEPVRPVGLNIALSEFVSRSFTYEYKVLDKSKHIQFQIIYFNYTLRLLYKSSVK